MNTPRAHVPMTMSGFCTHPSTPGHDGCVRDQCACECHETDHADGSAT